MRISVKIIGITGGVGSGKSTVLDIIEKNYNAYIIKADDVAKETYEPGMSGYKRIIEIFGNEILDADNRIDLKKLSDIVFKSPNKRIVLNSIIHPLVKKIIVEKIADLKIEDKYDYVFIEAALLIEDHYEVFCDELWYVYADETCRRERLRKSRGYTDEKIDDILKSQLSEAEFKNACSVVINNSGDKGETYTQLVKLLKK